MLNIILIFRDVPSELSGVSVRDLVKALGESRANGNGITPPDTPKRSASPRSGLSPKPLTRSSSPVAIPGKKFRYSVESIEKCRAVDAKF